MYVQHLNLDYIHTVGNYYKHSLVVKCMQLYTNASCYHMPILFLSRFFHSLSKIGSDKKDVTKKDIASARSINRGSRLSSPPAFALSLQVGNVPVILTHSS